MHIRNAPAEGMSQFGYHEGYKYPHDYPGHWVEQQYLPDKMVGTKYLGEIWNKGDGAFVSNLQQGGHTYGSINIQ